VFGFGLSKSSVNQAGYVSELVDSISLRVTISTT